MSTNDMAVTQRLNELLQRRREGIVSRRTFLKAATALGLSMPLATAFERGALAYLQDAPEGQLNIAMQRVLVSLDPHGPQSVEEPTAVIATHIFGTLLTRDGATGELIPSLATDWAADGNTWTFNLREGVTWQDGAPFTSADVQGSLQRVIDLEGPLAPLWATVTEIGAPDDLTRHHHNQRTASAPCRPAPPCCSSRRSRPRTRKASSTIRSDIGPYAFSSWEPDSQIELVVSDTYWGEPASVGTLVFRDIPETAAKATAIETGEIDFTWGLPADQLPILAENEDLVIDGTPSYAYYFNWFNSSREPFTDARVRQAMNYAIDRETLAADLLQGVGIVATAPIPATVFGWSEQTPYTYDPEKAKSLLAEAGLADGFDTHVIWVPGSGPQDRELILSFISNWADIGVNVESQEMEQAAWLEKLLALDWDMDFQTNTVRTGDADFTLRRLYTSTANRNGYANAGAGRDPAGGRRRIRPGRARSSSTPRQTRSSGTRPSASSPSICRPITSMNKRIVGFEPTPSTIPNFATVTIAE